MNQEEKETHINKLRIRVAQLVNELKSEWNKTHTIPQYDALKLVDLYCDYSCGVINPMTQKANDIYLLNSEINSHDGIDDWVRWNACYLNMVYRINNGLIQAEHADKAALFLTLVKRKMEEARPKTAVQGAVPVISPLLSQAGGAAINSEISISTATIISSLQEEYDAVKDSDPDIDRWYKLKQYSNELFEHTEALPFLNELLNENAEVEKKAQDFIAGRSTFYRSGLKRDEVAYVFHILVHVIKKGEPGPIAGSEPIDLSSDSGPQFDLINDIGSRIKTGHRSLIESHDAFLNDILKPLHNYIINYLREKEKLQASVQPVLTQINIGSVNNSQINQTSSGSNQTNSPTPYQLNSQPPTAGFWTQIKNLVLKESVKLIFAILAIVIGAYLVYYFKWK